MTDQRFLRLAVLFSLLHFVAMVSVDGVIFLLAHVPPKAANLDAPIRGLQWLYEVLHAPRMVLRSLWPGESSPLWLNWLLTVLNSVAWGSGLSVLKIAWVKIRK
ncbi:MAG: hypothetical protein HY298_14340 [Verrucomicrobia bacterium]|nr:hypothetical protein [Verrucomicrobiota bacterium]